MRGWRSKVTLVVGVLWMAAALACVVRGERRHARRPATPSVVSQSVARLPEVPRSGGYSPAAVCVPIGEEVVSHVSSTDAPACEVPSVGETTLADAVAELTRTVGGPDFAPAAEGLRRSLAERFAASDVDLEEALSLVVDVHTEGEVRAVVVEALAAGRGAARASQLAPALLLDPSTAVRQATWVHLLGRGEVACAK